jgi:hypothetical protein
MEQAVITVRIPVQSCHPFQTNAATHSILKLPLIPVNVATLWCTAIKLRIFNFKSTVFSIAYDNSTKR